MCAECATWNKFRRRHLFDEEPPPRGPRSSPENYQIAPWAVRRQQQLGVEWRQLAQQRRMAEHHD